MKHSIGDARLQCKPVINRVPFNVRIEQWK
jgi:hypothetical protein